MFFRLSSGVGILCLALSACGGSSPSAPSSSTIIEGHTVSALDSSVAASVALDIGRTSVRSDASGHFQAEMPQAGGYVAVLTQSAFVERRTNVEAPAEAVRLSLIPAAFDLRAFDEMCRTSNARLQRWITRPTLVVLGSVMTFTSETQTVFAASGDRLSDPEVAALVSDMTAALGLLTAGTYTAFAAVEREDLAAGAQVETVREGQIVVGRYRGIQTWAHTVGYGRWGERADGAIGGGSVYLDNDFDAATADRRLRTHELGHALGYTHVSSRVSIMNPAIGPEPTDFDRQAVALAFQRPPGNRSPDVDPGASPSTGFVTAEGGLRWSHPIP